MSDVDVQDKPTTDINNVTPVEQNIPTNQTANIPAPNSKGKEFWNRHWQQINAWSVFIIVLLQCGIYLEQTHLIKRQADSADTQSKILGQQTNLLEQQTILSQDPIIKVTPESDVRGNVADFTFQLVNVGVPNVTDVKIYEDYFVALKQANNTLTLYKFGIYTTSPFAKIPLLNKGEQKEFHISFAKTHQEMTKFYLSNVPGARMMVVRLMIEYRRQLDGKDYSTNKAYIIAGDGSDLLDNQNREFVHLSLPNVPEISLDEVKAALGMNNKKVVPEKV